MLHIGSLGSGGLDTVVHAGSARPGDAPEVGAMMGRTETVSRHAEVAHDGDLIADIQAYLAVLCRCRALVEVGEQDVAVHFECTKEAAAFTEVLDTWKAAGLVADPCCHPATAEEK